MKRAAFLFLIFSTAVICGCIKKDKVSDTGKQDSASIDLGNNKKIFLKKDREIYKVLNDSDDISSGYTIILSHLRTNANTRFDRVDFYRQGKDNLEKVLTDTTDFGYEHLIEKNKNGDEYLILFTDIGGTDTISSKGSFIYSLGKDAPKLVRYFDGGAVRKYGSDAAGNNQIIIFDNYIGVLPAGRFVTYAAGIIALKEGDVETDREETKKLFAGNSLTAKKEYDSVKSIVTSGTKLKASDYPLYVQTVKFFVYNVSLNDITEILKFWNSESSFLKQNLPDDEYGDLENFVTKVKVNLKST